MLNRLKKNNQGFTIIEVLIVLAIAGLILLIVFLAVPAMQRSSRNNGRKNDASRFSSGVSDFMSNNNGQLPDNAQTGTVVTNIGNMNQYDAGDRVANAGGMQAVLPDVPGDPHFRLVTGATCGAGGVTAASTNARRAAVQYQLETPNANVHDDLCLEL